MSRLLSLRFLLLVASTCTGLGIAGAVVLADGAAGLGAAVVTLCLAALATLAAVGWFALAQSRARIRAMERALTATREAAAAATLRDPLTGLGNYRLFETMLRADVARTQRYGGPLSVLLLEISEGVAPRGAERTAAQEQLLRFLSTVLRTNLREADFAARLSETMFGVVLCETDYDCAQTVWERLRGAALSHWPAERSWTLSGGVAGYSPEVGRVEDLLADANRRLALEKRRLRAEPET